MKQTNKRAMVKLPITVGFDKSKVVGYIRMDTTKLPTDFANRTLAIDGVITDKRLIKVGNKKTVVIDKIRVDALSLTADTDYETWLKTAERRSLEGAKVTFGGSKR